MQFIVVDLLLMRRTNVSFFGVDMYKLDGFTLNNNNNNNITLDGKWSTIKDYILTQNR
jgi:hypothetical protein